MMWMLWEEKKRRESGAKLCNINYDGGCNIWLELQVREGDNDEINEMKKRRKKTERDERVRNIDRQQL